MMNDVKDKLNGAISATCICKECGKEFTIGNFFNQDRPRCRECQEKVEWSLRCEDLTNEIRQKVIEHHGLMRRLLDAKDEEILHLKLALADVTEDLRQSQLDFLGISQKAGKMENVIKHLEEKLRAEQRVVGQEDQ